MLEDAVTVMQASAEMVKIKGGEWLKSAVAQLLKMGIPMCPHLGLTPQSVNVFGGFKVQGRDELKARQLREDAMTLADAGAAMLVLECVPTFLHIQVEVDEGSADPPTVVDAELRFADVVAAQLELAVFDEVVGAQVREAGADGGLAQGVAMDHPLDAQLMIFAVAGLLEIETVGLRSRAVLALAVGIIEVPPAPRHAVIEHRVVGGVLVIGHRIVTAAQHQLIGQAQRAVPIKRRAPLLLASAALAVITARQPGTPRILRRVLDQHFAATDLFAQGQLHLRLI